MIPDDIPEGSQLFTAFHVVQMVKSFIPLCVFRDFSGRKKRVEFDAEKKGVFHFILCASRVNTQPVDSEIRRCGVKVFVFNLTGLAAIQRIGDFSAESFHIEKVGATADFLIGSESDADGPMRRIFLLDEFRQAHDLRDTGLIIGSQKSGSVRHNDVLTGVFLQIGIVVWAQNNVFFCVEKNIFPIVLFRGLMLAPGAASAVSMWAISPSGGRSVSQFWGMEA